MESVTNLSILNTYILAPYFKIPEEIACKKNLAVNAINYLPRIKV
jgi:hypothetical protein